MSLCMVELESAVFNCYISIINYCYVINNNIWKSYERRMADDDFGSLLYKIKIDAVDFDPAELQSLLRVASLICKDRYEPPIREGLTCLRVNLVRSCYKIDAFWGLQNAMDRSRRVGLPPPVPAFPRGEGRSPLAHEHTVQKFPRFLTCRHVVTLPRGRKFSHSPIIQQIIEVGFHVSTNP